MTSFIKLAFPLLILFFFKSSNAQQQSISLVKYRSGKTIKIKPGERVKIKMDHQTVTGELFSVQDSNIIIAGDTFLDTCHLASIKWIKYKHSSYGNSFMQGSAVSIATAGPVYIFYGLINNALAGIEPVAQERNFRTGGILFLIGATWYGITELVINKKHKQQSWKIILNNFNDL
jgi:hypothetical protein